VTRWHQLLLSLILATPAIWAAPQETPAVALQKAIHQEVVDGNLAAAIRRYEELARGADRAIAAQALLRMAGCYERMGDAANAVKVYQRLTGGFTEQKEVLRQARARLAVLADPVELPADKSGWYNGDWQSGIPGVANWYVSRNQFRRVYDDFVVPSGGWTIVSVFSNNHMDFADVTQAAWEIRKDMSKDSAGTVIASGVAAATQAVIPGNGPFPRDPLVGYRIQVDELRVNLPAGRYWLNVAPIGLGRSFVSATRGRGAFGDPPGTNGLAYFLEPGSPPVEPLTRGQLGIGKDFSQGVLILKRSK